MELIVLIFILLVIINLIISYFSPNTDLPEPPVKPKVKQSQPDEPEVLLDDLPLTVYEPECNPLKFTNQFCSAAEKAEHLTSPFWANLKHQRLVLANHQCESCGSKHRLELHHVTYENLLNEELENVAIVCRLCHQSIHDKYGYDRTTYFPIK